MSDPRDAEIAALRAKLEAAEALARRWERQAVGMELQHNEARTRAEAAERERDKVMALLATIVSRQAIVKQDADIVKSMAALLEAVREYVAADDAHEDGSFDGRLIDAQSDLILAARAAGIGGEGA